MKSVIIKDRQGRLLVRVTHHKNGKFSSVSSDDIANAIQIIAIDDNGKHVNFIPEKK
jgi:hypothetical protein